MKKKKFRFLILSSLLFAVGGGFLLGRMTYSLPKEPDLFFATFPGGGVKGKEVLDIVRAEIAQDAKTVYEAKKRVTIERVRQHLLEIEAKKKKLTADQLLGEIRTQHQDDTVTSEEYTKYIRNQGLNEKAVSQEIHDNTIKTLQAQKIMALQNIFIDELVRKADIQMEIPGGQ